MKDLIASIRERIFPEVEAPPEIDDAADRYRATHSLTAHSPRKCDRCAKAVLTHDPTVERT